MLHRQLQQPLLLNDGITGGFAFIQRGFFFRFFFFKVAILYSVMAEMSGQSHREGQTD